MRESQNECNLPDHYNRSLRQNAKCLPLQNVTRLLVQVIIHAELEYARFTLLACAKQALKPDWQHHIATNERYLPKEQKSRTDICVIFAFFAFGVIGIGKNYSCI